MSADRLRLFVAADIPDEARAIIASAIDEFRLDVAGARWVEPRNLHITLKFIGYYEEEGIGRLSKQLHAAAERAAPFEAVLGGCGAFPSPGRVRVIWVGMADGVEGAAALARKLDARLEREGVKREERPFRGHLTLARLRQPRDCTALLEDMGARLERLREMAFGVKEMALYRSVHSPRGPIYDVLERIKLGGAAGEEG